MNKTSKYQELSFEECVRIIYYVFSNDLRVLKAMLEELLILTEEYNHAIAPSWYESYKTFLSDNKREK